MNSEIYLRCVEVISQVVMAAAACYALRQIAFAKKTFELSSLRDAAKITVDLVEKFPKIIDESDEIAKKCHYSPPLEVIQELELREMTMNELRSKPSNALGFYLTKRKEKIDKKIKERPDFIKLQNKMEAFATPFILGVANEELAYASVGDAYCGIINQYYVYFCLARSGDDESSFPNAIKLFQIWNQRRKNEITKKQLAELEKKMVKDDIQASKVIGGSI